MKVLAYAIYDTKAEFFQRPFFAQTDGLALRAVSDEGVRPGSELHRHPSDYLVFCVGEFDDSNGKLSGFAPRNLGVVKSIISAHTEPLSGKTDQRSPDALGDVS